MKVTPQDEPSDQGNRTPDELYHYSSLDDMTVMRSIIIDHKLKYSHPNSFNDPFDCQFPIQIDGTEKQLIQYAMRHGKKFSREKLTIQDRRKKAARQVKNILNRADNNALEMNFNQMPIGVISLSRNPCNILMWSHYGKSHTGVCFGFKLEVHSRYFLRAQPVHYQDKLPQPSIRDLTPKGQEPVFLTKFTHWKYEEEYRLINTDNGPGIHPYPAHLLKSVTFGLNSTEESRERCIAILQETPHPVDVYQAVKKKGYFAIKRKPIGQY